MEAWDSLRSQAFFFVGSGQVAFHRCGNNSPISLGGVYETRGDQGVFAGLLLVE